MIELENNVCDIWNEMSYNRFKNKKNSYKTNDDVYDIIKRENEIDEFYDNYDKHYSKENIEVPYGLYEDFSIKNCFGVEDLM